jgi:quinoprotein dehydrogenase-associated probable ABC transporter substrate-binding protein
MTHFLKVKYSVVALTFILIPLDVSQSAGESFDRWTTLRVCADPNSMPLSNIKEEGFENKIARLFAKELGWSLKYKWFPQRLAFFRNTIKLEDLHSQSGYACDVAIGASPDPEGAAGTKTYYTSTWVLVIPDTAKFTSVKSSDDLLTFDKTMLKTLKFGVFQGTPGADWVVKNRLAGQMVPFVRMPSDPKDYPGLIIEKNLAAGDIDIAIAWGPIAAYSASKVKKRKVRLIPMIGDRQIRTDYSIAMAVRHMEPEWKKTIEALIKKHKILIDQIIKGYGVPIVMSDGSVRIGDNIYQR